MSACRDFWINVVGLDKPETLNGGDDSFTPFTGKGGTGPRPQPALEVNASCLITVTNNTQAVLTLTNQGNERGDFMKNPDARVQPGASTTFAFVQTPRVQDPEQQGCKGSVTWDVGSPAAASWRCDWDNPVGHKNAAHAALDPQTPGFHSLAQIGQGDENVPVAFTISGGGQGPPLAPPVNPTGDSTPVPPAKPPSAPPTESEEEPEFNPPVKEKDPTLRLGDNSKDGWVEYLQTLLNAKGTPDPHLKEDGNFDEATLQAVIAFQKHAKIKPADGVVDNQTWAALRSGDPEAPGTDGREPHTFVDHGAKARWFLEHEVAEYVKKPDVASLMIISVGDAPLEGGQVTVRVTPPGSKPKVVTVAIGKALYGAKPTDQGTIHKIELTEFKQRFPSVPSGAKSEAYELEAYFDKDLGGESWKGNLKGDD